MGTQTTLPPDSDSIDLVANQLDELGSLFERVDGSEERMPGVRVLSATDFLGARPGTTRRRLERIAAPPFFGYRASATDDKGESHELELADFNSVGAALFTRALSASTIRELRFYFGQTLIGHSTALNLIRDGGRVAPSVFEFARHAPGLNAQRKERSRIQPSFVPFMEAADPLNVNRTLIFRVVDVSNGGLGTVTSYANKHQMPGLRLGAARLHLPGVGVYALDLQIMNCSVEDENIRVGFKVIRSPKEYLSAVAQFILLSGCTESEDGRPIDLVRVVRESGLPLKNLLKAADIVVVNDPKQLQQVAELRHTAYALAGKLESHQSVDSMIDDHDHRSVIFLAQSNGRPLATVRVVFCREEGEIFPFEEHFTAQPLTFEQRRAHCEASRLAVHPDAQGSDVLVGLFQRVWDVAVVTKRRLMYLSATQSLEGIYKRLGARKITGSIPHPTLNFETLSVYSLRGTRFHKGIGMSAISWDLVSRPATEHLVPHGFIRKPKRTPYLHLRKHIEKMILRVLKKTRRKRAIT